MFWQERMLSLGTHPTSKHIFAKVVVIMAEITPLDLVRTSLAGSTSLTTWCNSVMYCGGFISRVAVFSAWSVHMPFLLMIRPRNFDWSLVSWHFAAAVKCHTTCFYPFQSNVQSVTAHALQCSWILARHSSGTGLHLTLVGFWTFSIIKHG